MHIIADFGIPALFGTIWLGTIFVTIMVYGTCMAAARADRLSQHHFAMVSSSKVSSSEVSTRESNTRSAHSLRSAFHREAP